MSDASTDPVTLTTAANESEAAMIVAALGEAGIEAHAVGGLTSGLRAEAPGEVQILVHQHDLERGATLLREIEERRDGGA